MARINSLVKWLSAHLDLFRLNILHYLQAKREHQLERIFCCLETFTRFDSVLLRNAFIRHCYYSNEWYITKNVLNSCIMSFWVLSLDCLNSITIEWNVVGTKNILFIELAMKCVRPPIIQIKSLTIATVKKYGNFNRFTFICTKLIRVIY